MTCSFYRFYIRFGSANITADCVGIFSVISIARSACSFQRRIFRIWCVCVIYAFRCENVGNELGVDWSSIIRICNINSHNLFVEDRRRVNII